MRSYKAVLGSPVPGACVNRPRNGQYFSDEGLVGGGGYSGHPALHPSGQLKLFKIVPDNFVWLLFSPVRKVTRALTP